MGTLPRHGSVEITTEATPEEVWAVLADVTRAGEWSHETRGGVWLDGATEAVAGARFRGLNMQGRTRWSRICEIERADRPRALSWRTIPTRAYRDSTRWTVELTPVDGGTRITQRFEVLKLSALFEQLFYLVMPAHRDRTAALEEDLRNLGEVAAGSTRERPVVT